MLPYGGSVHFAAGEYGGHDETAQEICSHHSQSMPHLAQLQRNPEFQLFVQDVDRMVVVQLQQALQDTPSHILVIFFLGLLHNLVEGVNFFLRTQYAGENGVALGLGSQVGKTLINNIRLNVLFGIFETRYRFSSALARLTRTHLLLLHRTLLRRGRRRLDFRIVFQRDWCVSEERAWVALKSRNRGQSGQEKCLGAEHEELAVH